MANVRNLKKDINFVLGDIIEAVYIWEMSTAGKPTDQSQGIIDEAIEKFDSLIARVNDKKVENKKAHFKGIYSDLEGTANQLVEKINSL
ncbi:hypothetical protein H1R17_00050 [Flavobacterium sp. xlx-214]|uniref:hypothetical protein n=1 Tax=unclassified Flavobacterium TaxID=196869 RepID=UPI0013D427EA|nr:MULTISPECIES: hypothetical protein [unclassified Flavobacterium]MBA5791255.1 hypothetical protein [Flavobacterium sp. xlx-221]QMI83581.1 hypothetical protein H1R17_00050 [Flavobacterium sp. xlx-214]